MYWNYTELISKNLARKTNSYRRISGKGLHSAAADTYGVDVVTKTKALSERK